MYESVNTIFSTAISTPIVSLINVKRYLVEEFESTFNTSAHITTSITPLKKVNLNKAVHSIENIIKNQKPFTLKIGQLLLEKENGVYFIQVEKSLTIQTLHKKLLLAIAPYVEGLVREKDIEKLNINIFTNTQLRNIEKYGYAKSMELYSPQISLGRIPINKFDLDKLYIKIKNDLEDVTDSEFYVDKMYAIFETGSKTNQNEKKVIWERYYNLTL